MGNMRIPVVLTLLAGCAAQNFSYECTVKQTSLEFAAKIGGKQAIDNVYASLDFPSGCPRPATAVDKPTHPRTTGKKVFYVSPNGDDTSNGLTESTAFKSLPKAREMVRRLSEEDIRSGVVVNIMKGTHYLASTFELTDKDSGLPGYPITWQGQQGSVVSGGVKLNCTWTKSTGATLQCIVPSTVSSFMELFISGDRRVRARYPNGDPLIPKSGYASGCTGHAETSSAKQFPLNANVKSKTGAHIATVSLASSSDVVISDMTAPRDINNCKTTQQLYYNTRFNETYNNPFWNTVSIKGMTVTSPDVQARMAKWADPTGVVVKMYQPSGWGSWGFESSSVSKDVIEFARGGNQEARGDTGCGGFYVENVAEELDAPLEWFFNETTRVLKYFPKDTVEEESLLSGQAVVEVPQHMYLWSVRGTAASPAHDIVLQGVNVTRASPTYLQDYEVPSGGDWSVHRGAALFVDGAERVTIDSVGFDQLGGNAVFFSNYVKHSAVTNSNFWRTGDSAFLVVGSTKLALGNTDSIPEYNTFSGNLIDTVGFYMKQTSCFFKGVTHANVIENNVCYNGPRAGFNFNDGFMGGDLLQGNLVFNMVTETGDHGTFNSWDRRDWVFPCVGAPSEMCMKPKVNRLVHNMFLGPAGWNVDHDDGSSQYEDAFNTVFLGGFKYRDGDYRNMTGNIMVQAQPWFQVTGFPTDYFTKNTMVDGAQVCGPSNLGSLTGTTYVTISGSEPVLDSPLGNQCDKGTAVTMTWDQLATAIRALWPSNI
eukprot:TRINITY_DN33976_c0_g1_i1.p1 TRINITY_DN33976_c0_g1~~TRINITY_DN33976_c0_g1_i1.p1  ORF type:complete len:779 (+),score=205.51 TRINITY_DN33976_c0_g1_i1:45-2339(+)